MVSICTQSREHNPLSPGLCKKNISSVSGTGNARGNGPPANQRGNMSIKVKCTGLFALSRDLTEAEVDKYTKAAVPAFGEGPLPYIQTFTLCDANVMSSICLHDYDGSCGNYAAPTEALNAGKKYLDSIGVSIDPSNHISLIDDEMCASIVYFDQDSGEFIIEDMEDLAEKYLEMRTNQTQH